MEKECWWWIGLVCDVELLRKHITLMMVNEDGAGVRKFLHAQTPKLLPPAPASRSGYEMTWPKCVLGRLIINRVHQFVYTAVLRFLPNGFYVPAAGWLKEKNGGSPLGGMCAVSESFVLLRILAVSVSSTYTHKQITAEKKKKKKHE